MKARKSRWLAWLLAPALATGVSLQTNLAGGGLTIISPGHAYVDISETVKSLCSSVTEKRFADGVRIQVLAAPEDAELAGMALQKMEQVHDVLAGDLEFALHADARLYLYPVSMEDLPSSVHIKDKAPGIAVFTLFDREWERARTTFAVDKTVFETLPHEWTHEAMVKIFKRKSVVNRKRWIVEGAAAFIEYEATRRLSPDRFQGVRARYLPFLNLGSTSLASLEEFKYSKWPPDIEESYPLRSETDMYGAALGLFLTIEEHGGVDAVWRFLRELDSHSRIGEAGTDELLKKATGKSYAELAAVSQQKRSEIYTEALGSLENDSAAHVYYGLAVVEKFPDREADHIHRVIGIVKDPNRLGGIREYAAKVVASQAEGDAVKPLLDALDKEPASVARVRVELILAERRLRDSPVCGLDEFVKLASVNDDYARGKAIEALREAGGGKGSVEDLRKWAETQTSGKCGNPRERSGQQD